jgi:flavin-dependent dehydrogenase
MLAADVVVAGGGVAGLLIASALGGRVSVIVIEQADALPRNKYWLTDESAAGAVSELRDCIETRYDFLDFVAYDGLTATVRGQYCLWDTDKLIGHLEREVSNLGVEVLTGHRLYTISTTNDAVLVRANEKTIRARLLIDCMGFGSPLVGAKGIADITGYYVLHGRPVRTNRHIRPIALDNVVIDRRPAFLELFPTSTSTAHAAIILPSRQQKPERSIKGDLHFILGKSHYSEQLICDPSSSDRSYFGIIPVGRLRRTALERIVFFGEAGQANPATSATGLSRMLHARRPLADALFECLRRDHLEAKTLQRAMPKYMSRMNRVFQECVFESLLSFDSDDFRRLVQDLAASPDDVVNDLVFAQFDFGSRRALPLALSALQRPNSVLGRHVLKSIARWCAWRSSV